MQIVLPYVSIQPNKLTTYLHYDQTGDTRTFNNTYDVTELDNKAHGIMSKKANKRVRLAIDWLLYLAKEKPLASKKFPSGLKFKLNFITLTLSSKQIHPDNVIKAKLLNHFLTELREKYKCTNYLWRAESQSNGNIHFHICTDVYIPWRVLRTDWNRIQEKLGYISAYEAKSKKSDPNSTDIHSINAVRNLGSYLSKYCTKNSHGYTVLATKAQVQPFRPTSFLTYKHPKFNPKAKFYRQIHGKLWGLSQNLSKYQSAKGEVFGRIEQELEWLRNKKASCVRYVDMATVYLISVKELLKYKCMALVERFNQYTEKVLKPVPDPPPPVKIIDTVSQAVQKLVQNKILFN